jgi:type III pantothenate kinase
VHTTADVLVLDVGNTRTKLGLFRQGRLQRSGVIASGDAAGLAAFLAGARPGHIALGSVAATDPGWEDHLRGLAPVTILTGASPAPVRSAYSTPLTLGVDRLANAAGAWRMFPGRAALAIDLGTCITHDLVDPAGVYRGGAIAPGLRMRLKAMSAYSARLPLMEPVAVPEHWGHDTGSSLNSGAQWGVLFELQGFIARLRHEFPDAAVVLTGGDAVWFTRALKSGIFAHPSLTLEGLYAILDHQRGLSTDGSTAVGA